jgi:hypothetical protein
MESGRAMDGCKKERMFRKELRGIVIEQDHVQYRENGMYLNLFKSNAH